MPLHSIALGNQIFAKLKRIFAKLDLSIRNMITFYRLSQEILLKCTNF